MANKCNIAGEAEAERERAYQEDGERNTTLKNAEIS